MTDKRTERRLVENELVFRELNEKVQRDILALNQQAKDSDQSEMIHTDDGPLYFYCECSDENCVKRIKLKLTTYTAIHEKRDQFVIVPDHNVQTVEDVITEKKEYWIVKKKIIPPKSADKLNKTGIHNT